MAKNLSNTDLTAGGATAAEEITSTASCTSTAPLTFNPEDYRSDIKDLDLTTEQADELLATLWHIMSTMVNIGWGVDTVQLMLPELFNDSGTTNTPANDNNPQTKAGHHDA